MFGTELTEIIENNNNYKYLFMFIVHFIELFIYLYYDSVSNSDCIVSICRMTGEL
jgi:hypothetical protein